jgi:hypothetical protein
MGGARKHTESMLKGISADIIKHPNKIIAKFKKSNYT